MTKGESLPKSTDVDPEQMRKELEFHGVLRAKPDPSPPQAVIAKLPSIPTEDGEINIHSSTWIAVKVWAEARLKKLREDNDNQRISERDTATLRGQIKGMKALIDLPDSAKKKRVLADDLTRPVQISGYDRR